MDAQIQRILDSATNCINIECDTLNGLFSVINEEFAQGVLALHRCKGRIIVTGIGKSAIIAQKIVATLNSTGTLALFMHAADAIHGDLGMVTKADIIICISKSGETPEIKALLPLVKNLGSSLHGIVSNPNSSLAKNADHVYYTPVAREAEPNNLAPTASTTAQLAMGDAIAVSLLALKGFSPENFAHFHPGGSLGKQLYLKVSDIYTKNQKPEVYSHDSLQSVILEMTKKRLGSTAVISQEGELIGMITDGDLRRMLDHDTLHLSGLRAEDIMTKNPKSVEASEMALTAFQILKENAITQLPVIQARKYMGMIHLHDLIQEGFI